MSATAEFRVLGVDDGLLGAAFHVVDELRGAGTAEERARIVLRLPDELVLQMAVPLLDACRQTQFGLGVAYLTVRIAALCTVRDASGNLPAVDAAHIDRYRGLLCGLGGVAP